MSLEKKQKKQVLDMSFTALNTRLWHFDTLLILMQYLLCYFVYSHIRSYFVTNCRGRSCMRREKYTEVKDARIYSRSSLLLDRCVAACGLHQGYSEYNMATGLTEGCFHSLKVVPFITHSDMTVYSSLQILLHHRRVSFLSGELRWKSAASVLVW